MESVLFLAAKHKEQLGAVRTVPGWKAAIDDAGIWLKGPIDNGRSQIAIKSLPAKASYRADDKNRLFPEGKQTPVLVLENMEWLNLPDFLPVELPVSAMPAETPPAIAVRLTRTFDPEPAAALVVPIQVWTAYRKSAPQVRLRALRFAINNEEALITGAPLPSLKGRTYWQHKNILIPSGYTFEPLIIGELVSGKVFPDDLALMNPAGEIELIPALAFKSAERNSI